MIIRVIMRRFKALSGEIAQYLAHDYNDTTIRYILDYSARIFPDILGKAAKYVAESVDVLHSSFIAGTFKAHWEQNDDLQKSDYFTYINYAESTSHKEDSISAQTKNYTTEDVKMHEQKDIMAAALEIAANPIPHRAKSQFHCTLLQDSKHSVIVVRVSHLCVDGGDSLYLLYKLVETYRSMEKNGGEIIGVDIKNGNRDISAIKVIDVVEHYGCNKEIKTGATLFTYPTSEEGTLRITYKKIDKHIVSSVKEVAKGYGATLNDALLTSFYYAYASSIGMDRDKPMSIMSMMDARRLCPSGDTPGLSNFSAPLPTSLLHGLGETPKETLQHIASQTSEAKAQLQPTMKKFMKAYSMIGHMPLCLISGLASRAYKVMGLGMTNMGAVSSGRLMLGDIKPSQIVFGGPLKRKPSMQISVIGMDEDIYMAVVGQYTDKDKEYLEGILEDIAEFNVLIKDIKNKRYFNV